MTPGAILFGIALLILVVLFIAQPLVLIADPQQPRRRLLPDKRQELLVHKEALLEEIRTLDFDFETGKIPPETYEAQRAELVAEAAEMLKQLDALPPPERTPASTAALAEIEAAIARRKAAAAPPASNGKQEQATTAVSAPAAPSKFCSQCGQPVKPDDKFCAACGHALVTAVI